MDEASARQQICDVGQMIWNREMVAANDGNISARLDDGTVICTPTGVSKGLLSPGILCHVAADGTVISEPEGYRTSSEVKVHLRLYEAESRVNAVVHAHPTYGTLFAIAGEALRSRMMPENVVAMPEIPLAPYATPSTVELADAVEPFVHGYSCCLMEQHGALSWGADLREAYQAMERLEFTARLTYLARAAKMERDLPDDEVERLIALRATLGM